MYLQSLAGTSDMDFQQLLVISLLGPTFLLHSAHIHMYTQAAVFTLDQGLEYKQAVIQHSQNMGEMKASTTVQ